jgi:hypothetical protein
MQVLLNIENIVLPPMKYEWIKDEKNAISSTPLHCIKMLSSYIVGAHNAQQ